MSKPEDVISYVFTWRANPDACPKCQALNGREYRGQDLFAAVLVDPEYGPIWDLNRDMSLMHGGSGTCRCTLEVRVHADLAKLTSYPRFREDSQRLSNEARRFR